MTYRAPTFLSDDTFLMVNLHENAIDFIRIGAGHSSNDTQYCHLIGKLRLPTLRRGSSLTSASCSTDPLHGIPGSFQEAQRRCCPIRCKPEKAIIQFCVYAREVGLETNDDLKLFAFIARRSDLLKIVEDRFREGGEVVPILWDEWGRDSTRWSESEETETAWAADVAGQRQAFARTGPSQVHLRDFNPATIAKAADGLLPQTSVLHSESTHTSHQNCFQEDITSSLAFVETRSAEQVDYDSIFLDEERVVGLTVSHRLRFFSFANENRDSRIMLG